MEYRFFWTTSGLTDQVLEPDAFEALTADGTPFTARENQIQAVRLQTSELAAGVYFLLVTSSVTGDLPLARSRPITIQHQPQIQLLEPDAVDITLDSGLLLDRTGTPTGMGQASVDLAFQVADLDDTAAVHLFFSENAELDLTNLLGTPAQIDGLDGATPITGPEGVRLVEGAQRWDIREPQLVPAGDYFIYAVATDGKAVNVQRSARQIQVRHSPFLRLDALNDQVLSGADTITTGGARPQRFISVSWGRSGRDGDMDVDDDARIDLFYSLVPAQTAATEGFALPGGADKVIASVGAQTHLITAGVAEDPDARSDNLFVWDLWSLEDSAVVPATGQVHYLYGVIGDGQSRYLAQMNGGRANDAASRLVFIHPPALRPLQPLTDIVLASGRSARVGWEDIDLDSDARIRILLTTEDHGNLSDYATVTSGIAYVVNSIDGGPDAAVNTDFDLSEDNTVDHFDVQVDHITRPVNGTASFEPGAYRVYLAIEDGADFDVETLVWKAPGLIQVGAADEEVAVDVTAGDATTGDATTGDATTGEVTTGEEAAVAEPTANDQALKIFPEVFSLGTGGSLQEFEVRVDANGAAVDLVVATLLVDGNAFSVVDQDADTEGIQAFRVGADFNPAKLVPNEPQLGEDGTIRLQFEYLEPTATSIPGLDGQHILGIVELVALELEGLTEINLEVEVGGGGTSRLENDGAVVLVPSGGVVSRGSLVPGRTTLRGIVDLEGRVDKSAVVDFSLRPWASYESLADSRFAAANDIDPERDGVQVALAADGVFELLEVPTGRLDLFVHLDGYLDAWARGLDLFSAQVIEAVRPISQGEDAAGLMLGGDVAGYAAADNTSQPDNQVTLADWDFVAAFFGRNSETLEAQIRADITGDGLVNVQDLALVGANFLLNGPRPVFKEMKVPQALPIFALEAEFGGLNAGKEKLFWLTGDGLEGMQAFQAGLHFFSGEWEVVEVGTDGMLELWWPLVDGQQPLGDREEWEDAGRPWKDTEVAAKVDGGELAASLRGRGASLAQRSVLARWRLRALVDRPQTPWLAGGLLVDQEGRAVKPRLTGAEQVHTLPLEFHLKQNKPNPFNPMTAIDFAVPAYQQRLRLEVYNVLGQRVATLWDGPLAAGSHSMIWNGLDQAGKGVASGVYLYQLQGDGVRYMRRMLLLR